MSAPVLRLRDVTVTLPVGGRDAWPWTKPRHLTAIRNLSFDLAAGETLGLVGESGSGKAMLARVLAGTVPASSGAVQFQGRDLAELPQADRRPLAHDIQMVFHDARAALDPRMTLAEAIAEPLRSHSPDTPASDRAAAVQEIMDRVGLPSELAGRRPPDCTDVDCQRAGIARALVLRPKLVIADDPVSRLDVSVRAQIINLLTALQRDMGFAMIFISDDVAMVAHIASRMGVMYLGHLVELGPAQALIREPLHPYTEALVSAVPVPDPRAEALRRAVPPAGQMPSLYNPPSGCIFRKQCPIAVAACAEPADRQIWTAPDRMVACPFHSSRTAEP